MTDSEIISKLEEMGRHYDEGWTIFDIVNDLEEIFAALARRVPNQECEVGDGLL